jgi:ribosome-associated protein
MAEKKPTGPAVLPTGIENELQMEFIRASGPGGQNVNKVATAVQLRFDVTNSAWLAPEVKTRLASLAGSRLTESGVLLIEAKRYRTQEQNRADAIARLARLIEQAMQPPKIRRATRPTLTARLKRVETKKRRSEIKKKRRSRPQNWD